MSHVSCRGHGPRVATFEHFSRHRLFDQVKQPCYGRNSNRKQSLKCSAHIHCSLERAFESDCWTLPATTVMRIWAVSDVHTDYKDNMAW
jgi:hypothetical protein